jgi:hypothetical protein
MEVGKWNNTVLASIIARKFIGWVVTRNFRHIATIYARGRVSNEKKQQQLLCISALVALNGNVKLIKIRIVLVVLRVSFLCATKFPSTYIDQRE